MVQPSDPIAYLRFTEGVNANIPGYDSGNVATEEDVLNGDTYGPSADENGGNAPQGIPADSLRGPSYVPEPEWEGQIRNIIDIPGFITYPDPSVPEQRTAGPGTAGEPPRENERSQNEIIKDIAAKTDERPGREVVKDIPGYINEAVREETEKDIPAYSNEEPIVKAEASPPQGEARNESLSEQPSEPPRREAEREVVTETRPPEERVSRNESINEQPGEQPRGEIEKDIPGYIAETVREEAEKDIPEKTREAPREDVAKDIPERTEEVVQTAEARPPEEQRKDNLVPVPTQDRPPPSTTIYGIDPSDIIPGVATVSPVREPARPAPTVTPAVPAAVSSIPPLSLDRGWYYVQIASVDSLESVENIIRQIDSRYEPKAYRDSNNKFCILLKPMYQGESAAVLQRFRSIGFKDAFVRRGG
jgi:hypothetical protein